MFMLLPECCMFPSLAALANELVYPWKGWKSLIARAGASRLRPYDGAERIRRFDAIFQVFFIGLKEMKRGRNGRSKLFSQCSNFFFLRYLVYNHGYYSVHNSFLSSAQFLGFSRKSSYNFWKATPIYIFCLYSPETFQRHYTTLAYSPSIHAQPRLVHCICTFLFRVGSLG